VCGIVGILNHPQRPVERSILERMNSTIVHRGPDDDGFSLHGPVGLSMRRLRVIDLDGGAQPIYNEDRTCCIVFNGEIYNYPELRASLEARGHRFSTDSDTETIIHLYEENGQDCVDHLNGMFAFAIHDTRDNSVFIARDRLGIKPLYYAESDGDLVFGSEIKALLEHPSVSRELDPLALDEYLTFKFIPAPRTIYQSIKKLLPAHTLSWRAGKANVTPYWSLSFDRKHDGSDADLVDEFDARFTEAVRSQMLSDVPLGAFLSGGLDSSLIVSAMAGLSSRPIETFSIGFEEASYNELGPAKRVADHFETNHHELVVSPDARDLFERIVGQFDEPFGDSSAIPTYLVSELARQHVTVALSGTGADELFAGYERYWAVSLSKVTDAMPKSIRNGMAGILGLMRGGHGKRSAVNRARRYLSAHSQNAVDHHLSLISMFDGLAPDTRYTPAFIERLSGHQPFDSLRSASNDPDGVDALDRMLGLDTRTVLPDDYLTKDDRASMATSLELRVPFLDHTLVEFAAACPAHLKQSRLKTKVLLRKLAADRIPAEILQRPKHGFEIPIANWIAGDLSGEVDELLLSGSSRTKDYLRPEFLHGLIDRHRSGSENNSREIWSLMSLEFWLQSERSQSVGSPEG